MGNADAKPCCMFGETGEGVEVIEADTVLSVELTEREHQSSQDSKITIAAGTKTGAHQLSWGAEGLPMVAPVTTLVADPRPHMGPQLGGQVQRVPRTSQPHPGIAAESEADIKPALAAAVRKEGLIRGSAAAQASEPGREAEASAQNPLVKLPARVSPHLLYPWRNSLQPPHTSRRPVGPFVGEPFSSLLTYMRVVRMAEKEAPAEKDSDIWFEVPEERRGVDDDDNISLGSQITNLMYACVEGFGAAKDSAQSSKCMDSGPSQLGSEKEADTSATSSTQVSRSQEKGHLEQSLPVGDRVIFLPLLVLFELELSVMLFVSLLVTFLLETSSDAGNAIAVWMLASIAAFATWIALRVNHKAYPANLLLLGLFAILFGVAAGLSQLVVDGGFGLQLMAMCFLSSLLYAMAEATDAIAYFSHTPLRSSGPGSSAEVAKGEVAMTGVMPSTSLEPASMKAGSLTDAEALREQRHPVALALSFGAWLVASGAVAAAVAILSQVPIGVSIAAAFVALPFSLLMHASMGVHLNVSHVDAMQALIDMNTCIRRSELECVPVIPGSALAAAQPALQKEMDAEQGEGQIEARPAPRLPVTTISPTSEIKREDSFGAVEDERDSSTDLARVSDSGTAGALASTSEEDSYTYDPLFV